jgi:thiamine biosynthesis lipoprotein
VLPPQAGRGLQASQLVERHFMAMGTAVLVGTMVAPEQQSAAEQAIAEVEKLLYEFGRDGWAWGRGALAQFNRTLARGAVAQVPYLLQPLLRQAWSIHRDSGGLFEPRLGELVRLWGFDDPARQRQAPPPRREIEARLDALGAAPPYEGNEWYGPAPGIAWDLGAIGKGYIVDLALDWLGRRGCGNALINAGGNVAVCGRRGERPWCIGIRDPRVAAELPQLLARIEVRDESVITHGDDQRFFEYGGVRYSHILHPRSGEPARGLRSLTVVHRDGTLADAGGAALFVAGREWPRLAARLGIGQVLVVTEEGTVQATAALAQRLQPQAGVVIEAV